MSAYLKILPAVLFKPEALLVLGQKLCLIVRDSLLPDPYIEALCSAIEREGRTLSEVLSRTDPFTSNFDDATLSCEKACAQLKTGIQLYLFHDDTHLHAAAHMLYNTIENPEKYLQNDDYDISNDRIRDIIVNLESELMQQALDRLNLLYLFEGLKEKYHQLEIIQIENEVNHKEQSFPTLRSTISLYGMLVDTLVAQVRFENYRLLHRVETVLPCIEAIISEAIESTIHQKKSIVSIKENTLSV